MALIITYQRCDWCWGKAPKGGQPIIVGELAYCSLECRDWHAEDPEKRRLSVEAFAGLGEAPVRRAGAR